MSSTQVLPKAAENENACQMLWTSPRRVGSTISRDLPGSLGPVPISRMSSNMSTPLRHPTGIRREACPQNRSETWILLPLDPPPLHLSPKQFSARWWRILFQQVKSQIFVGESQNDVTDVGWCWFRLVQDKSSFPGGSMLLGHPFYSTYFFLGPTQHQLSACFLMIDLFWTWKIPVGCATQGPS